MSARMKVTAVEKLLTVEEAATVLGTTERFPRRLIAERRIRFVRLGGRKVRIPLSALVELIEEGTVEPITVTWQDGRAA